MWFKLNKATETTTTATGKDTNKKVDYNFGRHKEQENFLEFHMSAFYKLKGSRDSPLAPFSPHKKSIIT